MHTHVGEIEIDGNILLTLDQYDLEANRKSDCFSYHSELEISLVKSGSGVYMIDGRQYDIQQGDIFILNNIEPHFITSVDTAVSNSVILFDPRFIWSIENQAFDMRYLEIFFNRNEYFQNRLDRDNPAIETIRTLFVEIEVELANKLPGYELMVKARLFIILANLIRHFDYISNDSFNYAKRKHDIFLINKSIMLINSKLSSDIRMHELAAETFMSVSYFSTFFKKYIGLSPTEYIVKKRISRAVELLNSSDKTILEIAMQCGFNNTANFNKMFKKYVGRVPSDFRK